MRTTPLTHRDSVPDLDLTRPDGTTAELLQVLDESNTLVYFMRTPTCPVCHSHLRRMKRTTTGRGPLTGRLIVVVPGDRGDAAMVATRHTELADRIFSSFDAHAAVGLFVRGGLQQSGTFVVDSAATVLSARTATIPLGAYDEDEALDALDGRKEPTPAHAEKAALRTAHGHRSA